MARNHRELKYNKQMLVLTTEEEHQFIKSVANDYDLSMGEMIRKLIADFKEKQEQENNNNLIAM